MPDPIDDFFGGSSATTQTQQVADPIDSFFGTAGLDTHEKRLVEAKQRVQYTPDTLQGTWTDYFLKRSVPFGSSFGNVAAGIERQKAKERIASGTPTKEDYDLLATEQLEQEEAAKRGTGAKIGSALAGIPAIVGEAAMTGVPVEAPAALVAKTLGQKALDMLGRAGLRAIQAPAMPSLYLENAQQRAEQHGGQWWEPKNLATPLGMAAFQNVVLGHAGEWTRGIKNPLGRFAASTGLGAAEMEGFNVIAGALDEKLPDIYKTGTEYGSLGKLIQGYRKGDPEKMKGSLEELAVNVVTMAAFTGLHGNKYQAKERAEAGAKRINEIPRDIEQLKADLEADGFKVYTGPDGKVYASKTTDSRNQAKPGDVIDVTAQAVSRAKEELSQDFSAHVNEFKAKENLAKDAAGRPEGWDESVRQMMTDGGMSYEEAVAAADQSHGVGLEPPPQLGQQITSPAQRLAGQIAALGQREQPSVPALGGSVGLHPQEGVPENRPVQIPEWHQKYQEGLNKGLNHEAAQKAADEGAAQEWHNTGTKFEAGEHADQFLSKKGTTYQIDAKPQEVENPDGSKGTGIRIAVYDAEGNEVGRVLFDRRGEDRGGKKTENDYTAAGLRVNEGHQGQGIAEAMYDYMHGLMQVEKANGSPLQGRILPSADQTGAELQGGGRGGGKKLWQRNAEKAIEKSKSETGQKPEETVAQEKPKEKFELSKKDEPFRAKAEERKPQILEQLQRLQDIDPEVRTEAHAKLMDMLPELGLDSVDRDIFEKLAEGRSPEKIAASIINEGTKRPYAKSTIQDRIKRILAIMGGSVENVKQAREEQRLQRAAKLGEAGRDQPFEEPKLGLKKKSSPQKDIEGQIDDLATQWLRESQKKKPNQKRLSKIEQKLEQLNTQYTGTADADLNNAREAAARSGHSSTRIEEVVRAGQEAGEAEIAQTEGGARAGQEETARPGLKDLLFGESGSISEEEAAYLPVLYPAAVVKMGAEMARKLGSAIKKGYYNLGKVLQSLTGYAQRGDFAGSTDLIGSAAHAGQWSFEDEQAVHEYNGRLHQVVKEKGFDEEAYAKAAKRALAEVEKIQQLREDAALTLPEDRLNEEEYADAYQSDLAGKTSQSARRIEKEAARLRARAEERPGRSLEVPTWDQKAWAQRNGQYDWWPRLDAAVRRSVEEYGGHSYKDLNRMLDGDTKFISQLLPTERDRLASITLNFARAIDASEPLKENTTVFRKIPFETVGQALDFFEQAVEAGELRGSGRFSSTSLSENFSAGWGRGYEKKEGPHNNQVMIEIQLPAGSKVAPLGIAGEYHGAGVSAEERELTLPQNARFIVYETGKNNRGDHHIKAVYVGRDGNEADAHILGAAEKMLTEHAARMYGDPSPEAQATIADVAKQLLADDVGALVFQLEPGIWSPRTKQIFAAIRDSLVKTYTGFFDHIKWLGSQAFPGLERASAAATNAGMQMLSWGNHVYWKTAELSARLFPPRMTEEQRKEWGSAYVEERLRHAREAHLDAAARASRDAAAARQAGDKDAAREAAKKATEHIIKARLVPTNVAGFRGTGSQPARLLRNTTLRDERHFQEILNDPAYQKAMQGWEQLVTPLADQHYRDAQGMDYDDPIDNITQLPGRVMHMQRMGLEEQVRGVGKLGLKESSRGRMGNERLGKYKYAKEASFEGEMYENDIGKILENTLSGVRHANKAKFFRTLQQEGLGGWGQEWQYGEGYEKIPGVDPASRAEFNPATGEWERKGTQEAEKGETAFFVKKEHADDVKKFLGLAKPTKIAKAMKWFGDLLSKSAIASTVEPAYHSVNQIAQLIARGNPFMNVGRIFKAAWDYNKSNPEFLAHVADMAEKGLVKSYHEIPERAVYDPRQLLDLSARFLRMVDISSRAALDKAFEDSAKGKGIHKWIGKLDFTEENRRNFVTSAAGLYEPRAQHGLIAFLRDTGFGPFATAGFNYPIQGVRTLLGSPGGKAASMRDAIGLRAFQLAKLATVASAPLVFNYMVWGNPLGDDNTPLFAFKLGDDGKGKTSYFDPMKYFGSARRGMNMLGLAAVEDWYRRDKPVGKALENQKERLVNQMMQPFMGPVAEFGKEAITGKDRFGKEITEPDDEQRGFIRKFFKETDLGAAIARANPLVEAATETYSGKLATAGEVTSRLTGFFGYSKRNPPEVENFYDTMKAAEDRQKLASQEAGKTGLRVKEPRELTILKQAAQKLHKLRLSMNRPDLSPEGYQQLRAEQASIARTALKAYQEVKH